MKPHNFVPIQRRYQMAILPGTCPILNLRKIATLVQPEAMVIWIIYKVLSITADISSGAEPPLLIRKQNKRYPICFLIRIEPFVIDSHITDRKGIIKFVPIIKNQPSEESTRGEHLLVNHALKSSLIISK